MEDDFSIFSDNFLFLTILTIFSDNSDNFLPFHFHSILKIFHSILKFSFIFHSILTYQRNFRLKVPVCNVYFTALYLCNVVSNRPWRCVNNTKMRQSVSCMHVAHCLMRRRCQDFELGGGLNRKSHALTSSEIFEKRDFSWDKKWKIKSWSLI